MSWFNCTKPGLGIGQTSVMVGGYFGQFSCDENCPSIDNKSSPLVYLVPMQNPLDNETEEIIHALCVEGDKWAAHGDYTKALNVYRNVFDLLPPPPTQWEVTTRVLKAIGDTNFRSDDFIAGRDDLPWRCAVRMRWAIWFLHLRLGQCQYELGNWDRAADELARAIWAAGTKFCVGRPGILRVSQDAAESPTGGLVARCAMLSSKRTRFRILWKTFYRS